MNEQTTSTFVPYILGCLIRSRPDLYGPIYEPVLSENAQQIAEERGVDWDWLLGEATSMEEECRKYSLYTGVSDPREEPGFDYDNLV